MCFGLNLKIEIQINVVKMKCHLIYCVLLPTAVLWFAASLSEWMNTMIHSRTQGGEKVDALPSLNLHIIWFFFFNYSTLGWSRSWLVRKDSLGFDIWLPLYNLDSFLNQGLDKRKKVEWVFPFPSLHVDIIWSWVSNSGYRPQCARPPFFLNLIDWNWH